MPFTLDQDEWKKYKRYSNNGVVMARLVTISKTRMMQVRESRGVNFTCPSCQALLSEGNGADFPDFILPPQIFHEKYKPV